MLTQYQLLNYRSLTLSFALADLTLLLEELLEHSVCAGGGNLRLTNTGSQVLEVGLGLDVLQDVVFDHAVDEAVDFHHC